MKKVLNLLGIGFISFSPIMTVIACSSEKPNIKLLNELDEYIVSIRDEKDLSKFSKNDILKYVNYLTNSSGSTGHEVEKLDNNTLRLKIDVPWVKVTDDIKSHSKGRYVEVPHAGHMHRAFVTWEELAPSEHEIRNFVNTFGGRRIFFDFKIVSGKIDYENVTYRNPYSKNLRLDRGRKVNFNSEFYFDNDLYQNINSYKISLEFLQKLLDHSKEKINNPVEKLDPNNYVIQISDMSRSWKEEEEANLDMTHFLFKSITKNWEFIEKEFQGQEVIGSDFAYNYFNKGTIASDLHIEMANDITSLMINSFNEEKVVEGQKIHLEWVKNIDRDLFDWWLTVKPHNSSSLFYASPHLLKNVARSSQDEILFWDSVKDILEDVNDGLDQFKTTMPRKGLNKRDIPFMYYYEKLDNGSISDKKVYLTDYSSISNLATDFYYEVPKPINGSLYNNAKEIIKDYNINNIDVDSDQYKGRKISLHAKQEKANFNLKTDYFNFPPVNNVYSENFKNWNFPLINWDYAVKKHSTNYFIIDDFIFASKDEFENILNKKL